MPFYVAPEQQMKDRADFARKGIARGRAVAVTVGSCNDVSARSAAIAAQDAAAATAAAALAQAVQRHAPAR